MVIDQVTICYTGPRPSASGQYSKPRTRNWANTKLLDEELYKETTFIPWTIISFQTGILTIKKEFALILKEKTLHVEARVLSFTGEGVRSILVEKHRKGVLVD